MNELSATSKEQQRSIKTEELRGQTDARADVLSARRININEEISGRIRKVRALGDNSAVLGFEQEVIVDFLTTKLRDTAIERLRVRLGERIAVLVLTYPVRRLAVREVALVATQLALEDPDKPHRG